MINNRKMFENRGTFWIILGIILILFITAILCIYLTSGKSDGTISKNSIYEENYENCDEDFMSEHMQEEYHDDSKGYSYELIAENGIINVYSVSPEGERSLFYQTEIPYELLSESDKIMLRKGLTLNSMEELDSILQDFDS